jgi:hypothetical protein
MTIVAMSPSSDQKLLSIGDRPDSALASIAADTRG